MSLDKAIESGKEKRKPYTGGKAVACSCRNHGSCEWCKNNRLYQRLKEEEYSRQALKEYESGENVEDYKTDLMIRASIKAATTKDDLLKVYEENGLIGVYNLGLLNMLYYLNGAKPEEFNDEDDN